MPGGRRQQWCPCAMATVMSGRRVTGDALGSPTADCERRPGGGGGGTQMRDPDLVQRAEQAATELEQAWLRWRARHGLGSRRPPPVSSYVGYSVEEPWGQPRVILGVEASEAERLVAMLDGDGRVGPSRAEPPGVPEPRRPADLDAVLTMTIPHEQLPAGVEPAPDAMSESGSLAAAPAPSAPALPGSATSAASAGAASVGAAATPAELTRRLDVRLKDLAARVTALHPRRDARDQHPPEPTESGFADGSEPLSGQPLAADSGGRTEVLPESTLSRPGTVDGNPATEASPEGESRQPAVDTAV